MLSMDGTASCDAADGVMRGHHGIDCLETVCTGWAAAVVAVVVSNHALTEGGKRERQA